MILSESLQSFLGNLTAICRRRLIDVAYAFGAFYAVSKAFRVIRPRLKTTALRGPSNPSLLWGVGEVLLKSPDPGTQFEKWAEEYGGVYEIPTAMGRKRIVLCDPRAIAHLYAGEGWTYIFTPFEKRGKENIIGNGILSTVGETHRKLRKTLAPAFSNVAVRNLTPVFYDSALKAKVVWDNLIESNGGSVIIEVQNWMNHISLDTIGIGGFSHDFGALNGKRTPVTEIFDAFEHGAGNTFIFFLMLAQSFPLLLRLPTPFSRFAKLLSDSMGEITNVLFAKSREERKVGILEDREKSILGILIRAEDEESQFRLTPNDVAAQAKVLLLAGYLTTSISLTVRMFGVQWALIELCKNPDVQSKLRAELVDFGANPTYDQLSNQLPYLDAVVHETLRMHPAVPDFTRMAAVGDVIPLSKAVRTRDGKLVDRISVGKGAVLLISTSCMNRSTKVWGSDAKTFRPERWIEEGGIPASAREVQGHRHLLTFADGPRTCLGKGFAISEFKIALLVLVRHFVFELEGGPETPIEISFGLLPRPKVAGEEGPTVPLRVRRFE